MMVQGTDSRNNPYTLCQELLSRRSPCTKDFMERKLEDKIPVFVYGTLRCGGVNHSTLDDSLWLGDGITAFNKFNMMETPAGKFPVIFDVPKEELRVTKRGKVFGEVYIVDPKTLLMIDQLERNGFLYERRKIWITLIDQYYDIKGGKKAHPVYECWTYVAKAFNADSLVSVNPLGPDKDRIFDWNPKRNESIQKDFNWDDKIPF